MRASKIIVEAFLTAYVVLISAAAGVFSGFSTFYVGINWIRILENPVFIFLIVILAPPLFRAVLKKYWFELLAFIAAIIFGYIYSMEIIIFLWTH